MTSTRHYPSGTTFTLTRNGKPHTITYLGNEWYDIGEQRVRRFRLNDDAKVTVRMLDILDRAYAQVWGLNDDADVANFEVGSLDKHDLAALIEARGMMVQRDPITGRLSGLEKFSDAC
jgi:hypothetical protein